MLPVAREPIAGGAVLVAGDGRITACGPDAEVPAPAGAVSVDLGAAIVMPGLVNTHSHLELTALRGLVTDLPFVGWINRVRALKGSLDTSALAASARWGVLESFAAGITTTGDTGSSGAPARAMADLGMPGVAYHEVFGPDPAQCADAMRRLEREFDDLVSYAHRAPRTAHRLTIGISPHAPYTVSADLLAAVVSFAREKHAPLAMHLAESREETALLRDGSGPFAEALRSRGIAVAAHGQSPVAWASAAGLLDRKPLLIHCVETDDADVRAIAAADAAVAHCPWSNGVLGHACMNLAAMRAAGVRVGLGTDSVAPGGGIDLFRDARLAAASCGLTARDVVRFMTANGARALGMRDAGVLEPGAYADLVAVGIPAEAALDPEAFIAQRATPADVRQTWIAGRCVYDQGQWPGQDAPVVRANVERAGAMARAALS